MAEAETSSVENIISPNENIPKEAEAVLNAGENTVRRQSSINKMKRLKERENSVKILVMGLTGAGKSTLVNAMMGGIVAKCKAGAKACSTGIECHKGEREGIRIKIYDTAGFGENDLSERKILKNIAEKTPRKGYDLILIAIKMDNRLDADSAKKMLSSLGRQMDPEMWKRTIVVLTFANFFVFQLENGYQDYTEEAIKLQVKRETEEFRRVFQEHTGKDWGLVNEIPFVLAGSMKQRKLPTDNDWLIALWDHSILRCRTEVQPFLKRIRFQRLFVDLRLMIRNIFPITGDSERDSTEQHHECSIENGMEEGAGPECNGQGGPGQVKEVPLDHTYNGLEQDNKKQEEARNDDCSLQDGLEHVGLNLVAEMSTSLNFD